METRSKADAKAAERLVITFVVVLLIGGYFWFNGAGEAFMYPKKLTGMEVNTQGQWTVEKTLDRCMLLTGRTAVAGEPTKLAKQLSCTEAQGDRDLSFHYKVSDS